MSEQAAEGAPAGTEGQAAPEVVELPHHGDLAFGSLMDALAPETDAGEAGAAAGAPTAGDAAAPAGADAAGAAAAGGAAAAPAAGGDAGAGASTGTPGTPGDGAGAAAEGAAGPVGGDRPAGWDVEPASIIPELGKLSTALEENTATAYQQEALEAVRGEYGKYFEALEKHPRLLVGTKVPSLKGEGDETLRDSNDAKEWQEAVKSILVAEVKDRAGRQVEESRDFLQTVHASIELFQNNSDLIPGTKGFDVELANRFTTTVKPYEIRVEGKLHGYSIPVQPIIDQTRAALAAERAKAPAAAPAAASPAAGATADPPQAGIASKAGAGGDQSEDFSALFGTLGLPGLRI